MSKAFWDFNVRGEEMDIALQKRGIYKNMVSYENELVQRGKEGDLDSFNQLVEWYQGDVYNLTLRMLGTPQDAEDITQETFIQAWKAIGGFRGGNFRAWLFRIASNACTDLLRSKRRCKADSLDALFHEYSPLPSSAEFPEDCALQEELSQLISRTLLWPIRGAAPCGHPRRPPGIEL